MLEKNEAILRRSKAASETARGGGACTKRLAFFCNDAHRRNLIDRDHASVAVKRPMDWREQKSGERCWEAILRNNDFVRLKPWPCIECSQDAAPELVRRRRKRNMGEEEASRRFAQSARVLGVLPVRRRCLQKTSLSVDFC